jgi:hypothetical protein
VLHGVGVIDPPATPVAVTSELFDVATILLIPDTVEVKQRAYLKDASADLPGFQAAHLGNRALDVRRCGGLVKASLDT